VTTAFVSWAHPLDSEDPEAADQWRVDVFSFTYQLRRLGIHADIDLFHMHDDDVDWSTFGPNAIEQADYVLVVASTDYKDRWEGSGDTTRGAGAAREANVLKSLFERDRALFRKRVKLILLPGVDVASAPAELQSSVQRFPISNFEFSGLSDLLRTLTGNHEWPMPDVGKVPPLPQRKIAGLSTDSPLEEPRNGPPGPNGVDPQTMGTLDSATDRESLPRAIARGPSSEPSSSCDNDVPDEVSVRLDSVRRELDASPLSISVPYESAGRIRINERDRALGLDDVNWPLGICPDGWERHQDRLCRAIEKGVRTPVPLEESVLRFPSAPQPCIQHGHESFCDPDERDAFHTYRVLRSVVDPGTPTRRIFLFQVGLNELNGMDVYYKLASELVAQQPDTVCVVRPFPGHLTRAPFQAFAESPLDHYLTDSSRLYREFLRYMVETQWFLSTLARRSVYRSPSGIGLLADHELPPESRLNSKRLTEAIAVAYCRIQTSSDQAEPIIPTHDRDSAPNIDSIHNCVTSLRKLLRLDSGYPPQTGELRADDAGDPEVHVVGHSLGSFTAQALLMSWPYLVASCTSLMGGVTDPTVVHPEEWKTVLHSLRYELEQQPLPHGGYENSRPRGKTYGPDRALLFALARVFRNVFLESDQGSTESWLKAVRHRALFVVGNSPMRPSVQIPPAGEVTLLELADPGHMHEDREKEQGKSASRDFWMPEVARMIDRFADQAGRRHLSDQQAVWLNRDLSHSEHPGSEHADANGKSRAGAPRRLSIDELRAIDNSGALSPELFERCLDDMVARDDGLLFILGNEIPTVLQTPAVTREQAAALYHDDLSIAQYCMGVARRARMIQANIERVCFVVPYDLERRSMRGRGNFTLPSQSETVGDHLRAHGSEASGWDEWLRTVREIASGRGAHAFRVFDPRGGESADKASEGIHRLLAHASEFTGREPLVQVASLPDCWLWVSKDFLGLQDNPIITPEAIEILALATIERGALYRNWYRDLSSERLRIVNLSRARYNPRYRGRLIFDPQEARRALVHAALCLAFSTRLRG
jgi:pimeloyl-ACP methyl ester carboxylesterase